MNVSNIAALTLWRNLIGFVPRFVKVLDAFACATVFSSLDIAINYHQILIKQFDIE